MLGIFSVSLGVLLALSFAVLVLYFYLKDITQKKHAILRNFPLIGRLRCGMNERMTNRNYSGSQALPQKVGQAKRG